MRDICITVDVEDFFLPRPAFDTIFARQGGAEFGIGRIMQMLEEHGASATFYVDVFNRVTLDEALIARACTEITRRGHEVGLHTHPAFPAGVRGYGMAQVMCNLDKGRQQELIGQGKDLIRGWTGQAPRTHRAGGYGANTDTLAALAQEGFASDSSHYHGYAHCPLASAFPVANTVFDAAGIREVPVTVTLNRFGVPLGGDRWAGASLPMKIDIDWLDLPALRVQVEACIAQTQAPVLLFLHSYSLLDLEHGLRPSARNIGRFAGLLQWLSRRPDIRFRSVSEAATTARPSPSDAAPGVLPECRFNLLAEPWRWAVFGWQSVSWERIRKLARATKGHAA